MRSPFALAVVLLAVAPAMAAHAADNNAAGNQLSALRWKARPVVILSDSRDDPRVGRQISALDHVKADARSRRIKVVNESKPGSRLRQRLGVEKRGFAVVLVGKDGTVKRIWHDPVAPKQIFTIIDRMPMRQREMRG